jgi:hypothetical protein
MKVSRVEGIRELHKSEGLAGLAGLAGVSRVREFRRVSSGFSSLSRISMGKSAHLQPLSCEGRATHDLPMP